ncbi:hypothetical protein SUGI_0404730 [Cryptomeria japonica]|nr:hypothetical protein SUGI_0404730 [Cryptomeria japonica]
MNGREEYSKWEKLKIHRYLVGSRLEILMIESLVEKLERRHNICKEIVTSVEISITSGSFSSPNYCRHSLQGIALHKLNWTKFTLPCIGGCIIAGRR